MNTPDLRSSRYHRVMLNRYVESWRAVLIACAIVALGCAPTHASDPRPNIVWISVEDMSAWLGCYGDTTVPTPNVDRLAARGIRFTRAYATTPVCAPARSTLITGMYATSIGSMHMRTGNPSQAAIKRNPDAYAAIPSYEATPPPEVRCFPELLRIAGYYCTNRSKQDYQFKAPVTVWDASSGKAHWRHREPGQPFFAVFNLGVTHESGTFPSRPRQPRVVDPTAVSVPPYYPDTPQVRDDLARTYDNIAAMDRQVGTIIDELESEGLLENTIVFFFSDHGVGLPRGKRGVYASGTHVPLIVCMPGVEPRVEPRLVSFVDFAPTVLSLAGIDAPSWMQGRAFLGEHEDDAPAFVFFHADRMDSETDRTRAVTDGRYRYIRHFMPERAHLYPVAYAENIPMMADIHALRSSGQSTDAQWQMVSTSKPRAELYDTHADPHEVVNVIDEPAMQSQRRTMQLALNAWIAATGDLGMYPEAEMVRTRLWPPDGVQPTTAVPEIVSSPQPDGETRVEITCATPGASIGYRFDDDGPWRVYTEPFECSDVDALQVVAHRIGYKPARR